MRVDALWVAAAQAAMNFKVAIPARYGSSRLPGKPLRTIDGKPMLQYVYERARQSGADEVVIATEDERIAAAARGFGATVCMTSPAHSSGTERLGEVVHTLNWPADTLVVNLQGDEPLMPPALLRQVARDLDAHTQAACATLYTPITAAHELFDPHVVKLVMNAQGYALYFSRAAIPWHRDDFARDNLALPPQSQHFRHLGVYAYRAGFLKTYAQLAACALEDAEALEQLRMLWHGVRIHAALASAIPGPGVDTEQDLQRVEALLKGSG